MSARSKCTSEATRPNNNYKRSDRTCLEKEKKRKSSWSSSFVSALFSPCSNKDAIAPKRVKGRAKMGPINDTNGLSATMEPQEVVPMTPHSPQETAFQSTASVPEQSNDLISLGDARELAQLKIDGITMPIPEEATETGALTQNNTLPPLDSMYRRKAVNTLKMAVENGDQIPIRSPRASSMKPKNNTSLFKRSKKVEKLNTCNEESVQTLPISKRRQTAGKNLHVCIAKEHTKMAELYQGISETQEKLSSTKKHITHLVRRMELEHVNFIPKIKDSVNALQKLEKQLRKKLDKVRSLENKAKRFSVSVQEPLELNSNKIDDRLDSNSEYSSGEEDSVQIIDAQSSPVIIKPCQTPEQAEPHQTPSPPEKSSLFSFRPFTANKKSSTKKPSVTIVPKTRIIYVAPAKPKDTHAFQ